VPGQTLGDLHALRDDGQHLALLRHERRLPHDVVVERLEDHPALRCRLQDRPAPA
jgi:hypothetical protein